MIILESFGESILKSVEKWQLINSSRMSSIDQGKLRNLRAKVCAAQPKIKKTLKNSNKILSFFDQNRYGKLTFFAFFLNIYWISDSTPKVHFCIYLCIYLYIPLQDNTRCLQQYFRFRGGGVPVSLPKLQLQE